ncbi:ABC transporter substrate-binding protein [Paucidesulfovibrio longus]|uniref:ABC transporter substrate-binding protein n=1 Tax=Paucidesulfovibrio longus TaxID=889 RepID=UPI0003B5212B|nr:ABC transporter substrate-binding protein [Paucidesulfovibrio longus]
MKRFISPLLALLFSLALLAGCGSDKTAEQAESGTKTPEQVQEQAPAASETAEKKPFAISITQIVEHPSLDAMRQGFKDRFAEKGVPAVFTDHIAQGDMATNAQIGKQIKGEEPDLILAITTPSAQAVVQAIDDRPIVFTGVTDPVSAKIVASLEHPGANVTGMTDMSPLDKHVELIRTFLPEIKKLGVIYNAGETNSVVLVNLLKAQCAPFGIEVVEATIDNSSGVYQAAKSLVGRCEAIYVPVDNTVVSALESAIKVCEESKLPLFTGDTDSVARGSIAALAVDYYKMGVQTADMAIRILVDGANPADTPVEYIRDLSLHVNKKAAAAMGVTIPESVLEKASKVIE